jgi:uncharacterized membrane protein
VPRYNFEIMHLNHRYISSIACPLLSSKISLLLNVCLIVLLIMIFFVLLGLSFPFLHPYHAHKLDLCSTPYVFLGYSSSYLGYRCLDLASQCIYVSRHVRFHENVFPLAKSEQIAPPISTST